MLEKVEKETYLEKSNLLQHDFFLCTTLNIVFSVTNYLELRNARFIYYKSHILPTHVKLVVGHYQTLTILFGMKNIQ